MGELGFNKFFGAALATFLLIFGLNEVSTYVFGGGGHHGDHHYDNLNEWAADKFHGYRIDIPDTASGGGADEGPVFDLGALLAGADIAAGETVLKRQCATCHTWNEGGANGTGPNLYGVIGRDVASAAGFNYSGALSGIEGNWSYEQMNAWLINPGSFARGTSMAYAGLRSPRRDNDRVNLMAYLASLDPAAPAFPAPLVTEASLEEEAIDDETATAEAGEDALDPNDNAVQQAIGTLETATDGAGVTEAGGTLLEQATDAGEAAVNEVTETGSNLLDQAQEVAEEVAETVEDATDGEH